MWDMIKQIFTDAMGRPEVKIILGVPLAIAAVIYGMISRDWAGFNSLSVFAGGLLGVTAIADALIDFKKPTDVDKI